MSTNHTANYNLSQWEPTDKVLRADFNEDNAKIDAVLGEHAAQLARRGNCRIWTTTYTGTGKIGTDNPTRISFPELPLLAMVMDFSGNMIVLLPGAKEALFNTAGDGAWLTVSWAENTVSFYTSSAYSMYQMNSKGGKYCVFALFAADAE